MTLKEHYKFHSRKSIKPLTKLFLLILLVIAVPQTFARYANVNSNDSTTQVAKWAIAINGEQITNNTNNLAQSIQLINSADGTTKIDSGDECYFDITITPVSTEVSISYTISLDLTSANNTLPEGTKIEKYIKYSGSNEEANPEVNIDSTTISITEDISLTNTQEALGNTTIRKYRIYCILPDFLNAEENQEYSVEPKIIIQQNINNT